MLECSILLFVLIFLIDLAHYATMFRFLYQMRHKTWTSPQKPFEPKSAVILTLRGVDPSLKVCVQGLLHQIYRDYTIFFVFDSESDPALPVVQEIIRRELSANAGNSGPKYEIVIVKDHLRSCSLKCNSLVHVIEKLDESFEVAAILDADTLPFPTWLQKLVEPLSDRRFVAVSGLRWYVPEHKNWGSLIRMLWNIAAVNQMVFSRIPWGGAFALRREVFFSGGLLERWKQTLTDDVSVWPAVRALGAQTLVTPSILMINREFCHTASFYPWVKRQLVIAKLYHPYWKLVVGQAFFLSAPLIFAGLLGIYGLSEQNRELVTWNVASLLLYIFGVLGAFVIMDGKVRQFLRGKGEKISRQTFLGLCKTSVAIVLTQIVYTLAICSVFSLKRVEWRGITYCLGPEKRIQMEHYVPYWEEKRGVEESVR